LVASSAEPRASLAKSHGGAQSDSLPIALGCSLHSTGSSNHVERLSLAINRFLTHLSSIALAVLMFLTVADVFGRYLFNRPVPGTFELTEMLMVLIVFMALGLAQHHNEHISLDLAYNYFPERSKAVTDIIVEAVNLLIVAGITWQLSEYSVRMSEGNYTTAVLELPIRPFVVLAIAGTASYGLAILCALSKAIGKFRWEKP
jgi:TRAP-type transport system small permease protein